MRKLLLVVLAGCAGETAEPVPAVYFEMFYGSHYDMTPFNAAWSAARANPTGGLAYTFPLVTVDLEPGTEVRLLAGRSPNPGYPPTTADDVLIADEHLLTTSTVADDGRVEFSPLAIAEGSWTSGTNALPADFLCGDTVIAVRAFERGTKAVPAYRFLAATWMVAVTDCAQK